MTVEVRRLNGPFATRVCLRSGPGYAWREARRSRLTGLRDAPELEALAAVLPTVTGCTAVLPYDEGDDLSWSPVATSTLAVEAVFGPAAIAAAVFGALGVFLRRLHAVPIPDGLSNPVVVRPSDAAFASARDTARRSLSDGARRRPGDAADDPGPPPGEAVLTHGRFSLGQIAWGRVPAVMGWREAGPAPALTDVDTLLSELAEADAVRPGRVRLASAFVTGYGGPAALGDRAGLAARLHGRVLDHLALRAAATGDLDGPSALYELVLGRLDGFCAEVLRVPAPVTGAADAR